MPSRGAWERELTRHASRRSRSPSLEAVRIAFTLALLLGLGSVAIAGDAQASGAASTSTIDLLVVYPRPASEQLAGLIFWNRSWGETEMGPFLDANFGRVTQIYQQSGVPVEFRVAHSESIDLSSLGPNWKATLSSALMNSESPTASQVPYLEAIESLRDLHAADIVIYWRQPSDDGPTSNGAGSVGGGEDEAYVHLTYSGINPPVAAHETGHLLGGQHQEGVQGSATFSIDGDTATLREYRSVMTATSTLELDAFRYLWRFSQAGTSITGSNDCSEFSGALSTCDFPSSAPLGDADHDAATTLAAMAPVVAAFRTAAPAVQVPAASPLGVALLALLFALAGLRALAARRARA